MDYELNLIKKWQDTHAFEAENDRFKPKKIIKCPNVIANSSDLNSKTLYPYLCADVYNRYSKMLGENVFYGIGFNFPNAETFDYTSNHYVDNMQLFSKYQESLDLMGIGYDKSSIFSFYEPEVIKYIQKIFLEQYNKNIFYKNGKVLMDSLGSHIYNIYETYSKDGHFYSKATNEELFYQTAEYYSLNVKPYYTEIKDMINSHFLNENDVNQINQNLGLYTYLEIPLYNYKDNLKINIELNEPQYMAGVTALLLNPQYMDVMPYVDQYEKESVIRFLQNGYQEGVFTGNMVKNPLTGEDILLFVSYDFEEAVHALIPAINECDVKYALAFGIDYRPIVEDGLMINSDFLNGLDVNTAKKTICQSFLEEGMAKELSRYAVEEIIISKKDGYGIPMPVFLKNENEYVLSDLNFLPIFYNNRQKISISNEDDLDSNLEFALFEFNDGFLKAIEPIIISSIDSLQGQNLNPFEGKTVHFIDEDDIFEEYLYPNILSIILGKKKDNVNYEMLTVEKTSPKSLMEYCTLNLNFCHDILKKASSDAYRMYILSKDLTESFDMTELHISKYENYVKELENVYNSGFSEDDTPLNVRFFDIVKELNLYLSQRMFDKYIETIMHFFYTDLLCQKMNANEALIYLKLVSIVCPFISQKIFEEVFHQNYLIIYEEWPFMN